MAGAHDWAWTPEPDKPSGDINEGLPKARSGVEQSYQSEVGANKQIYVTQVDSAGQIRTAGFEAAKLRQTAAVIAAVGREISREVGQGMRIRFWAAQATKTCSTEFLTTR